MVPVLYENDEIYIINKPSGLAVQGGNGVSHSLDNDFAQQVGQKVFLVHRLDKDTAGLMIVAKSAFAANKWTKLIGSKIARKEYIAVCAGTINPKKGVIKDNLVQHGDSKAAVTYYCVEKEWSIKTADEANPDSPDIKMSQIRLQLETGRMHQIRIHAAELGCPIVGDAVYGSAERDRQLRPRPSRQLLHAVELSFLHPVTKSRVTFMAPPPPDLVYAV